MQSRAGGEIDVMRELRKRAAVRVRRRGDSPSGARRAGLALAGVIVAAGVLLPQARLWGEWVGRGSAAPARTFVRADARERGGAPQEPAGGLGAAPADSGRGFSHRLHRSVACTSCHVSGSSHGALKVRTHEDCRACHHATGRAVGCTTCHEPGKLPASVARTVQFRTSVAPGAMTRTLTFGHSFHASVACADCHEAGPQHRAVKDCTSCHERHHTAARDCQRCHRPADVKGHPASVHDGCGGGGCHSDPAVAALAWSRPVCTSCHQDKVRHQPGRDCATCHQVPALHENRKEAAR